MSRVWMAIQVAISAPSCIEILSPATPRLRVVLFTLRMAKMASSFVPQSRQSRPSLVNARHPEPREAGNQVSSWYDKASLTMAKGAIHCASHDRFAECLCMC
jgi:hypothetical protein